MSNASFYRRPLPSGNIPFSNAEGRKLFREALADGTLEGYFALAEQYHTQADPAFCGLGSLVVALNALAIDPARVWKGPWRWFAEDLLDCCAPLDEIRRHGVTIEQLACLARCNGAKAAVFRAEDSSVAKLRDALDAASETEDGPVVVASYSRAHLGQTGAGHFSPVAGLHRRKDLALILDVARFKYPPHWVAVDALWNAMLPHDPETEKSRGWLVLERSSRAIPLVFRFTLRADWKDVLSILDGALAQNSTNERHALQNLIAGLIATGPLIEARDLLLDDDHVKTRADALIMALRCSPFYAQVRSVIDQAATEERSGWLTATDVVERATLLVHALLDDVPSGMPHADIVRAEIDAMIAQLAELRNASCALTRAACSA